MTTLHHIGELLQSGVRPTDEETEHLKSLGGFVAEMYGRYLHGRSDHLKSGPGNWSDRLSSRLSANNGARWEQGLGLGEMFLSSDLTSFWDIAKGGFSSGYEGFDVERPMLDLYEEEASQQPQVAAESAPRRRRPSLFGAKGTHASASGRLSPARLKAGAPQRRLGPTEGVQAARWADGSTSEMTVVKALEAGGLFVGDQVTQLIAESGEVIGRPGRSARAAAGARDTFQTGVGARTSQAQGGAAASAGNLGSTNVAARGLWSAPPISLDGLRIDERTPALASALSRAQSVFGRSEALAGPAVSASRLSNLGSIVPFSMEGVDRGYGLGERPVYGFYDAAETTYVNLPSDRPDVAAPSEAEASPVSRRGRTSATRLNASALSSRAASTAQAGTSMGSLRGGTPGSSEKRSIQLQRNGAPNVESAVSLDAMVRPATPVPGTAPLRPLTGAVLGRASQGVPVASEVSYMANGVAVPRVQRGGVFAPRISVTQLGASDRAMFADGTPDGGAFSGQRGREAGSATPQADARGASLVAGNAVNAGTSLIGGGRSQGRAHFQGLQDLVDRMLAARGDASSDLAQSPQSIGAGALGPAESARFARTTPTGGAEAGSLSTVGAPQVGSARGAQSAWRLASDMGPDLPLGAAFTRGEVFGGLLGARAQTEPRANGESFRPIVAGDSAAQIAPTHHEVAQFSRLPGLVDGLVWVSLPVDAASGAAEGGFEESMGLKAVPVGRRSAMVPSSVAMRALTMRSRESSRAGVVATEAASAVSDRAANVSENAGGQPLTGVSRPTGSDGRGAVAGRGVEARLASNRMNLSPSDRRLGQASLQTGVLGGSATMRSSESRPSTMGQGGQLAPVVSTSMMQGGQLAPVVSTSMGQGEQLSIDGGARLRRFADMGASLADGGSSEAASGGSVFAPTFGQRVANTLESAISGGGYGRLDAERVFLAAASDARFADPGAVDVGTPAEGRVGLRGPGSRLGRLSPGASSVRIASGSGFRGTTGSDFRGVTGSVRAVGADFVGAMGPDGVDVVGSGARGAGKASPQQVERLVSARGTSAQVFGDAGGLAATSGDQVLVSGMSQVREAHQALMRPVTTARESRAIASLFSAGGVVGRELGAISSLAFGGAGSDEPLLGRIVQKRTESGGRLASAASSWESSPELVARIASLESGARRDLTRHLEMSGWSEPELRMLQLESGTSSNTELPSAEVGDSAQYARGGSGRAVRGVSAVGAGQASVGALAGRQLGGAADGALDVEGSAVSSRHSSQINRTLARVLAGAEGLGGSVDFSAGSGAIVAAGKLAASPMPMLEGGFAQSYFGSLTPRSSPAVGYASLRDEIGELVKMAEGGLAKTSDPVAAEAQSGLLARARGVLARTSGSDRAVASRLVARLEAVAAKAQASGRTTEGRQAEALATSMGGRASMGALSGEMSAQIGQSGQFGLAGAFDADIARIQGVADVGTMGAGRIATQSRSMDIDEVEMAVLALERETAPGLEARLAKALAMAVDGPAGARRLMRGTGGVARSAAVPPVEGRGVAGVNAPITVAQLRAGTEQAPARGGGSAAAGRQDARLASLSEEVGFNLPVSLGKVIAPEVMLQGLRSPEVSAAIQSLKSRQSQLGAEMTRVLTTLADSGVDLSSARSSLAAVSRELGVSGVERFVGMGDGEGAASLQGYRFTETQSELAEASPEQSFLQLMASSGDGGSAVGSRSLAQIAAMVRKGGMSRGQRAGLLSSLLRGTERAERTSLLEEAGAPEFAFAWLSRVDGSRTGLDLGLGETRQEFGKAFGPRRDSSVAMDSPIGGASLVATGGQEGAARSGGLSSQGGGAGRAGGRGGAGSGDRSGLRSLAGTVTQTSTGASRPQHGASQAMRRTDWSFVDTGSRASTTHADLGKLAAAIVGSSESGQRAPMPLVAPAVKAVAQTALRDSKTGSSPSQPAQGSGGGGADAGKRGPVDAKMSEKAVEMLAIEMANRVARLMGLMKERIGVWS